MYSVLLRAALVGVALAAPPKRGMSGLEGCDDGASLGLASSWEYTWYRIVMTLSLSSLSCAVRALQVVLACAAGRACPHRFAFHGVSCRLLYTFPLLFLDPRPYRAGHALGGCGP